MALSKEEAKIIKSFKSSYSQNDVEKESLTSSASWERLKPYFEKAIGLRTDEELVGFMVYETGIQFKIKRK